LSRTCS